MQRSEEAKPYEDQSRRSRSSWRADVNGSSRRYETSRSAGPVKRAMSQGLARRSLHVLLDNRNSAAHSTQTYLSVLQLLLRLRNRTCGERQIGASLRRPLKRAPVTTSGTDSRRMSWWPHRVKAGSAPFASSLCGGDSMCRRSTVRTRSTAPVPFDGCGPSARPPWPRA